MDEKDKLIEELRRELIKAYARIAELERRLNLNSSNSSKSPTSDGLRKKVLTRESSSERFGGQQGHTGATLMRVEFPDETIEYSKEKCENCNASLDQTPVIKTIKRQVHDVVIEKRITSHEATIKICPCCKTENSGTFPDHVQAPAQYGPTIRGIVVYLGQQFISKDRLQQTMSDVFDVSITDTTLMKYDHACAENLEPFIHLVESATKLAPVKGADETGMRIEGKTQWLHVLCTSLLTYYRVSSKRGSLLEDIQGIVVHDHWRPYLKLLHALHAFCNAHHIRELKAVHELDLEQWADKMRLLLIRASKLVHPTLEQTKEIESQYDTVIQEGIDYHTDLGPPYHNKRRKRPGHNLLLRLQKFKIETLRFLHNQDVPFTNNLSERDLRMMKLHQKVSGCFRTSRGAQTFATIRSFVSTVRKQDGSVINALSSAMQKKFIPHDFPGLKF